MLTLRGYQPRPLFGPSGFSVAVRPLGGFSTLVEIHVLTGRRLHCPLWNDHLDVVVTLASQPGDEVDRGREDQRAEDERL